jgi:tRNA nucleotidyltransferase (CCA-adding enzyme)
MLAVQLASSIAPPAAEIWAGSVTIARSLLEAWFDRRDEVIDPKTLINGEDIMRELNLTPGPEIGSLLNLVREKQVVGEISTRQQALDFVCQKGAR